MSHPLNSDGPAAMPGPDSAGPHSPPTSPTAPSPVHPVAPPAARLYGDLAAWWPLMSAPEEYVEEAELYTRALLEAAVTPPGTLLEIGSGGGNNASHMKA